VKLPTGSAARVEIKKVSEYLLSETHPVGRTKAVFFKGLGIAPDELISELLRIARSEEVVDRTVTSFGIKYVVDGRIEGKRGSALVRTVWVAENEEAAPRLVTAYPAPSEMEKA
jgi:hypothetical protein